MTTASTKTQYRIDPNLKKKAEIVLHKLGVKPAQAITMFYTEISRTGTLPFIPTKIPNEELAEEMEKVDQGIGVQAYKNKEELFNSLNQL